MRRSIVPLLMSLLFALFLFVLDPSFGSAQTPSNPVGLPSDAGVVVLSTSDGATEYQDVDTVTLTATVSDPRSVRSITYYVSEHDKQEGGRVGSATDYPYNLDIVQDGPGVRWYHAVAEFYDGAHSPSNYLPITYTTIVNGITIDRIKVYDQRDLQSQLQTMLTSLEQNQFPSTTGLFGNVGQFQGARATQNSQNFSLQTSPTPSSITTVGLPTSVPGATSAASGQQTTVSSVSGTIPSLPSSLSQFTFQPTFGLSGGDTLEEQTELEYQISNLEMLTDGSITDRLIAYTDPTNKSNSGKAASVSWFPRAQAIVGFDISIVPASAYKNAVAEVEVTITPDKKQLETESPFLVSMMPLRNTYNVATVSQSSTTVGLGVVSGVVNAGYAGNNSKQNLYLIKDIDTIGLESLPEVAAASQPRAPLRFAWQFRPVLGQKFVLPGTRTVFADLGLPVQVDSPWLGTAVIKTYWRRLGSDGITVGSVIPGSESVQGPLPVLAYPASEPDKKLETVDSVVVEDDGGGNVDVLATGNFEPNSIVNLGSLTLDSPADGLVSVGTNRIKFVIPAEELFRCEPFIEDRFGFAVSLVNPDPRKKGLGPIDPPIIRTVDGTTSSVTLHLRSLDCDHVYDSSGLDHRNQAEPPAYSDGGEHTAAETEANNTQIYNSEMANSGPHPSRQHSHMPVIDIGGQVFGLSNAPAVVQYPDCYSTDVTFYVPSQVLAQAHELTVEDLLWGDNYRRVVRLPKAPPTVSATTAVDVSRGIFSITGTGLDQAEVTSLSGQLPYLTILYRSPSQLLIQATSKKVMNDNCQTGWAQIYTEIKTDPPTPVQPAPPVSPKPKTPGKGAKTPTKPAAGPAAAPEPPLIAPIRGTLTQPPLIITVDLTTAGQNGTTPILVERNSTVSFQLSGPKVTYITSIMVGNISLSILPGPPQPQSTPTITVSIPLALTWNPGKKVPVITYSMPPSSGTGANSITEAQDPKVCTLIVE